ncbi:zinc finger, CCHC-type containing protein [Tanacetum coccineum]
MSEHKLVKKFLTSLPRRFVHIVATLEQVLDLKTTRFEDVVGRLKAYEERVKQEDKANDSQEKLLYARTDYSNRNSDSIKGRGRGCDIRIRGYFSTMRNSCGSLLIKVPRSANRLYKAQLKVGKTYCLQANIDEESWLWHVRLGHIGFGANLMHKLAKGVSVIKHQDQVCESCMVGKHTKKSFSKKATYRALKILEMVHEGIARMLTDPYAPQQNGIVEQRNRTLLEMTRCMMKARGVTPCEKFYGEKPNLEDLKVFGCVAYERIVSKHLKKLDDRSKPLVYLGKEPSLGGFRLYNPRENKIIISAYVICDEKRGWKWKAESLT